MTIARRGATAHTRQALKRSDRLPLTRAPWWDCGRVRRHNPTGCKSLSPGAFSS
jgi:hypothetical protein